MKISTVNIVEYYEDTVIGVTSFTNDEEGNKEAEEAFGKIITDNGAHTDDIAGCIEECFYEQGTYQAFLIVSL